MFRNQAPLKVCQTRSHSTRFFDIHLPKGAVYTILPQCIIKGKSMPKAYVWVEDLHLARTNRHFTVRIFTRNDNHPRTIYVDGNYGYAHTLQKFIRALPAENLETVPTITNRDIRGIGAPKDRTVGAYIQRGRPSRGDYAGTMTDYSVTANCKVGKNFYTEEGYIGAVLGMGVPKLNNSAPASKLNKKPKSESDPFACLNLDVEFNPSC